MRKKDMIEDNINRKWLNISVVLNQKCYLFLAAFIIVALASGCNPFHTQYIPSSIKDMPKESLAKIHLRAGMIEALSNPPVISIDGEFIMYPMWGSLEIYTLLMMKHNHYVYLAEGEHVCKGTHLYIGKVYVRRGQRVGNSIVIEPGWLRRNMAEMVEDRFFVEAGGEYIWDSSAGKIKVAN